MSFDRVHFELSHYCNLGCKFCYAAFAKQGMSTEAAKKIIKWIKQKGTKLLVFGGGDPLLRKDLAELLEYCKELSQPVAIDTNGLLLNEEFLEIIKDKVIRIGIPLDGACEATQYKIRGKKGLFKKSMQNIKKLSKYGIPFKVNTMVCKHNLNEISKIGHLIEKYVPSRWSVHQFCPVERGNLHKELFEISNKEYYALQAKIIHEFPQLNIKFPCQETSNGTYNIISPEGVMYTVRNGKNFQLPNLIN